MKRKGKKKAPEIVLRDGKPTAVIVDIGEYQDMLERLEDIEDLKMLEQMRKTPLSFKSLDDFLKEYTPGVWSSFPSFPSFCHRYQVPPWLSPMFQKSPNLMNTTALPPRKRIVFSTFIPAGKWRVNPPASTERQVNLEQKSGSLLG
jgi:hypothetical protein